MNEAQSIVTILVWLVYGWFLFTLGRLFWVIGTVAKAVLELYHIKSYVAAAYLRCDNVIDAEQHVRGLMKLPDNDDRLRLREQRLISRVRVEIEKQWAR